MSSDQTRAARNNNPGNIQRGDPWQGLLTPEDMTLEQRQESRFCVFQSPKWGFRAMARILISYQDKYAAHTIQGAIGRWAPTTENNTVAYIKHVCDITGFEPDEFLNFHEYEDVAPVVKAIATHESGAWLFDDGDLRAGLSLAGLEPPQRPLMADPVALGKGAGLAGTGALGLTDMLSDAKDQLAGISYLRTVQLVIVALTFLSIGASFYIYLNRRKRREVY